MSASTKNISPLAGGLFMAAGVMFFVAAVLSENVVFCGTGAAMFCVGVVFIAQARKGRAK